MKERFEGIAERFLSEPSSPVTGDLPGFSNQIGQSEDRSMRCNNRSTDYWFDKQTSRASDQAERARLVQQLAVTQDALDKVCVELIKSKQQAQYFRFQSLHDGLTTLPNRLSILECLEALLKECGSTKKRLAVLFIDIDNFKSLNDLYGHLVGDEVLQIVSARIKHSVRGDDRVGRLGGDEFLCLIADAGDGGHTAKIADQIMDAVREPIQIGSLRMVIQTSIGIAFSPDHAITAEALISQADAAMYRAKRAKFGHEVCDSRLDAVAIEQ